MSVPAVNSQPAQRPEDEVLRRRLDKVTSTGLKKLWKTATEAQRNSDPTVVHDLRVATRRLQALVSIVPLAKRKADRLTKRLKRLRHGLGDQRDRDVMLGRLRGLLEKSTDPVEQRVWQETVKCLERETAKNTGAARRELRRFDQKSIRRKIGKLLAKNLKSCDPWAMVNQSLRQAARNWRLAVRTAVSGGKDNYHALRIKTKTLRYSLELVNYLLTEETEDRGTAWLKELQDELGGWHDEVEFCRRIEEVANGDASLRDKPGTAAILDRFRSQRDADTNSVGTLVSDLRLQERSPYPRSTTRPPVLRTPHLGSDERRGRQMPRNLLEVLNKA